MRPRRTPRPGHHSRGLPSHPWGRRARRWKPGPLRPPRRRRAARALRHLRSSNPRRAANPRGVACLRTEVRGPRRESFRLRTARPCPWAGRIGLGGTSRSMSDCMGARSSERQRSGPSPTATQRWHAARGSAPTGAAPARTPHLAPRPAAAMPRRATRARPAPGTPTTAPGGSRRERAGCFPR